MSFFICLGVPPCFINLFISSLDDAMSASDLVFVPTILSISAPNEE